MSDEIQTFCRRRQNLRGLWDDDRGWGCRCVPGQLRVVDSWVVWSGALSFQLRYRWSVLKGNNGGVRGAVTQILCLLLHTAHTQKDMHTRDKAELTEGFLLLLTHITGESVEGVVYRYVGHLALSRWYAVLGWLIEHRVSCHWWPLESHTPTHRKRSIDNHIWTVYSCWQKKFQGNDFIGGVKSITYLADHFCWLHVDSVHVLTEKIVKL